MRDEFSPAVKALLAQRAGNRCANPGCQQPTSGPHEDPTKAVNIGVAAHITAAAAGGARFDPSLTAEQRRSPENGIWLCQNHGKLVDNDEIRYSVEVLRTWKRISERRARGDVELPKVALQYSGRGVGWNHEGHVPFDRMKPGPIRTAVISAIDPDKLAINDALHFTAIRYGSGPQAETILPEQFLFLPETTRLADSKQWVEFDRGYRYVIKSLFSPEERAAVCCDGAIHVPQKIVVCGRKTDSRHWVSVVRVADIRYVEGEAESGEDVNFELDCLNDRGGLAAFLDAKGAYQTWNPYICGDATNGVGSVGILVLIEWDGETPLYRSRYLVIVRKGIRYPDDVWWSTKTQSALLSPTAGPIEKRRFIFQSREAQGGSTDVFIADFDGRNLCNVSADNPAAYDGFYDDEGNEVVAWVDDKHVRYCSMKNGTKRLTIKIDPSGEDS